jgi:anti-anti-sigma regulatory factor
METSSDKEIFAAHRLTWDARADFNRQYRPCSIESRYIVDFSTTTEIDAVGIGLILQLAQALGNDSKRLFLARAHGAVLECILGAELDRIAEIGYPLER